MFDWVRFFDQYGIEYVTSGPNVGRNHVVVHCPFCGLDDPSHHMSIHLGGAGWRCWRNPHNHKGKSPIRLISALISCSYEEAARISGAPASLPNDFLSEIQSNLSRKTDRKRNNRKLKLPSEFRPFLPHSKSLHKPSVKPFVRYLTNRGFDRADVLDFTNYFDVWYCTRGPYKDRVIFPVRKDRKLVTWTGRSRYRTAMIRYKTLSDDPEISAEEGMPAAVGPITDYLLWWDELLDSDAHTIHVVEGPMDALKIRVLGYGHGITATCLFTSTATELQIELLHQLLPRFKRRFITLDQGMLHLSLELQNRLAGMDTKLGTLPKFVDDPGELNEAQLLKIGD